MSHCACRYPFDCRHCIGECDCLCALCNEPLRPDDPVTYHGPIAAHEDCAERDKTDILSRPEL